jgi:hypothetical protein
MAILADIGPATTGLEAAATAIGAGVVAGGLVIAGTRRLLGHRVPKSGTDTINDGFWGGLPECYVC